MFAMTSKLALLNRSELRCIYPLGFGSNLMSIRHNGSAGVYNRPVYNIMDEFLSQHRS